MAACRMSEQHNKHIPVLLQEAVTALLTIPHGIYIDATFGRGSHSKAILNQLSATGRLIAFDKDPDAIAYANQHLAHDPRFTIIHDSFANMQQQLASLNVVGQVAGILFDLGVSSPQLDNPERGFSFMRPGPLDMRMDPTRGVAASTWLQTISEEELATILWKYGEEKFSKRIARAIVTKCQSQEIATTTELAEIIKLAIPPAARRQEDKHPATRSFQAIRIAVNHELSDLEVGLDQALEVLQMKGRLAVISFHSLEDRIVKQFIRQHEKAPDLPRGLPIKAVHFTSRLKSVGKPQKPSPLEMNQNPRARSAILRIAEKQL